MKQVFLLIILVLNTNCINAQRNYNIFNSEVRITWLGLDFTQMKYIGDASQFQGIGNISSGEIRDQLIPAWNDLFIDERKKYSIAEAINRIDVKFAVDITAKVNSTIETSFFETDTLAYQLLSREKINQLINTYDFKQKEGIGLLFFIEGMHNEKKEMSVYVTFVDMTAKNVLLAKRVTGKAAGITGFRNFWAKSLLDIIAQIKNNWHVWEDE